MSVSECPSCGARVLPGSVACKACGFDFIKGTRPQEWLSEDDAKQRVMLGGGVAALLVVVGVLFMVFKGEEVVPEEVPCIDALTVLRGKVQAGFDAGAKIPSCADTPPGPVDCWAAFSVTAGDLAEGEKYRVTPNSVTDFDIECRVDKDFDGNPALFRANPHVEPVRITPLDVK